MKIALCQFKIEYKDKKENFKEAEKILQWASEEDTQLILFPEMSFTGFSMNTKTTGEEYSETITQISEWAKQYRIAIGFGWVKNKENSENHYTVIDEKGNILGDYIKIHPFSYSNENNYFKAGNELCIFTYKEIRFGITICYDLRFPEIYQRLSEECDVIITAANWPEERIKHWDVLLQARAIENQVYMIGVNCVGLQDETHYSGHSKVIAPDGKILLNLKEDSVTKQIDLEDDVESYRLSFPMKKDRRKNLYKDFYS